MSKSFFEVFSSLQVTGELRDLFQETTITRLAFNRGHNQLKIYLESDHLIHKKWIYLMEEKVRDSVCTGTAVEPLILEHFTLSSQYTPQRLMEEYYDSLTAEFWHLSPVMGCYFREAKMRYSVEDGVTLQLENSEICRRIGDRIRLLLDQIFTERCGMPVAFSVEYTLPVVHHARRLMDEEVSDEARARQETVALSSEKKQTAAAAGTGEAPAAAQKQTAPSAAGSEAGRGSAGKGENAAAKSRTLRNFIRSSNPDVIFGRDCDEKTIPIHEIQGEVGEVCIRGQIMANEQRDIRNNKSILKFTITDFTDSIICKIFAPTELAAQTMERLSVGNFVKVKGFAKEDAFEREVTVQSITGIMAIPSFLTKRQDHYEKKRVELHMHTKMSDMDGVTAVTELVKRAYSWGWPAVAITDHGNVQAFPDANLTVNDLYDAECRRRKTAGEPPVDRQDFFKVIYGVECYLVDDLRHVVTFGDPAQDPAFASDEVYYSAPVTETAAEEGKDRTACDKKDQGERSTGYGYETGVKTHRPEDYALEKGSYVVFDIETTGFSADHDRIIEIGAVRYEHGSETGRFSEFINPGIPIPYRITRLTSITDEMVKDAPGIEAILPRFLEFCRGCVTVGHNVSFDIGFIQQNAERLGLACPLTTMDTMEMARVIFPGHKRYNLDAVGDMLNVVNRHHHRAVDDADATAEIFTKLLAMFVNRGAHTLGDVNAMADADPDIVRRRRPFHCILLAKNTTGRVNLYRMISASNLTYFYQKPKIPKSMIQKYREGILVGSACVAGELYQALLDDRSEKRVAEIVKFYDYLEIQPRANNHFLVEATTKEKDGSEYKRYENIRSDEDLLDINRRIVALGEKFGKPVVATGDAHFMDPEDQIYRTIIQDSLGMKGEEAPAPLFLHTTDEMMEEFAYLGADKCEEVVITNTQKIADMVDAISPVRPDKCPPVIENSDQELRDICYARAHAMYGDPLPKIVEDRLDLELNSIIRNGYSVMYIIAQKLVWKSNEDGYLVGSRGSVGSSLAAFMSGITEVNALRPHYYCKKCHYSDFDSPEVIKMKGKCGVDLPDKVCPRCGTPLTKDGYDIPFQTFLGFKGDKEPDIDLNFSGEYQAKAHAYTKVIFGHEQTFKAGTIATVAEKTAYGYVLGYCERNGLQMRRCETERLSKGCMDVRRSTGQHPGGIVVLPVGEEINTFTPVQHPANDMETPIITTHFDYHKIDHNLLKLDILGHDDPTMIRMLQDLTGVDPLAIRLDDPEVMSLFTSTKALGITPEQDGGIRVGTLGVPEFGTKFVMGMLEDTQPHTMSELIKISGLSHGTDVWLGNAQEAIAKGYCTLANCIGCRDDIMTYLINMGLDPSESFTIMERVRKGKVAKGKVKEWPEWCKDMKAHGVPDWYMRCCEKIQYMFPKGHAAAYVMMALRIAWFKVHQPLAYYAAYYSIRAKAFDYEIMAQGRQTLESWMASYEARKKSKDRQAMPTSAEDATYDDCLVVREMYARGIEFTPIELGKAQATHFSIHDGRLMPAYTSLHGMGGNAAVQLEEACRQGPFLSKEEVRERGKVSQTLIDTMKRLGILKDLPETNQFSLFDLGLQ